MRSIEFVCNINTSDPLIPLGLEIWSDNQLIYNNDHVKEKTVFSYDMASLADGDHQLRFVLKNKLPDHTTVVDGQIIKDAVISVDHFTIDGIDINQLFMDLSTYDHDYNGTQQPVQERFYGQLGCNGTVTLNYSMPAHQWMLDYL